MFNIKKKSSVDKRTVSIQSSTSLQSVADLSPIKFWVTLTVISRSQVNLECLIVMTKDLRQFPIQSAQILTAYGKHNA